MNYVDLQVNGCKGVDFNSLEITEAEWLSACQFLASVDVESFLPTLITDSINSLIAKLKRLATLIESSTNASEDSNIAVPVGIHLEGPFISSVPGFVGAHPSQYAIPANLESMKRLLDSANGKIRLVTLAPECDPRGEVIKFLLGQGVIVSAGHSDASRDQLWEAIDNGLQMFTHLGNACPAMMPRHDNIIQRAMSFRDSLHVSLIADGHHLPSWLLRILIEHFGVERCVVVSDSISAAGLPSGVYQLGDRSVRVGEDGVPRSEDGSHFIGSGATLQTMHRILRDDVGLSESDCDRLLGINARRLLMG